MVVQRRARVFKFVGLVLLKWSIHLLTKLKITHYQQVVVESRVECPLYHYTGRSKSLFIFKVGFSESYRNLTYSDETAT